MGPMGPMLSPRSILWHFPPPAMPRPIYDLTFAALERELAASGLRPAHARTLWRAVHREGTAGPRRAR